MRLSGANPPTWRLLASALAIVFVAASSCSPNSSGNPAPDAAQAPAPTAGLDAAAESPIPSVERGGEFEFAVDDGDAGQIYFLETRSAAGAWIRVAAIDADTGAASDPSAVDITDDARIVDRERIRIPTDAPLGPARLCQDRACVEFEILEADPE